MGGSYTTLYQGSSSTWNHTFTLASGVSEQRYDVELRVRNSVGLYHTRTIQVTVTRNNKSLYYLSDHLGSVRVTVNERGDPVGWDDYYPFGLQMPERNQNASNAHDDQKFTGYELEQQGNLEIYYAVARMYDPEIGRFMQRDPHAANYPGISPYTYVANNPLIFIDPDGRDVIWFDNMGREINRILNDDYDQIMILDAEGRLLAESALYDPGTISDIKKGEGIDPRTGQASGFSYMTINDEDIATEIFEFLAQSTTVEWSQV